MTWKKGRGKLGPLAPLIGAWEAQAESPMGTVRCTRTFSELLGGKYIALDCVWHFGKGDYTEHAVLGAPDGELVSWSFTSDGKHSRGALAAAPDIHPDAVCFEADMPAGRARQVYWPDGKGGMHWEVAAQNKKGWKPFVRHHYKRVP